MNTRQVDKVNDAMAGEDVGLCGLLPWYLNGSVPPVRVREIDAHLRSCIRCQEARELWGAVQQQRLNDPVVIGDVEAGLRVMEQRLDRYLVGAGGVVGAGAPAQGQQRPAFGLWHMLQRTMPSARLTTALMAVLVAGIGVALWPGHVPNLDAPYMTLSESGKLAKSPAVAEMQQQFRILFHRDTTDARMQAIFNQFQAQVVAGPTAKGVYTVVVPAQSVEPRQIADALRREPEVLVAEWISGL